MVVEFQFDFDRAMAAMLYIAKTNPYGLDTYKMCKLIFLSDKLQLVRNGRPITGDSIVAMEFGPVPSDVYRILCGVLEHKTEDSRVQSFVQHFAIDESFQYPRFSAIKTIDFDEMLSRSDMKAIDEIIAKYGDKTFEELKVLTHEMPAWKNAWNNPERRSNNPRMSLEELFEEDAEAKAGVREEMIENYALRQVFNDHC